MDQALWQLWIDTGGTFTDCLARDPDRAMHRVKVLSSGALRAMLLAQPEPTVLRVRHSWGGQASGVVGLRVRALSGDASTGHGDQAPDDGSPAIERFDAEHGLIVLSRPWAGTLRPGTTVEASGGEDAPVLAARLITGTPLQQALPPIALRLATTRATNALLQRRGARVAFFVTRGFGDLMHIGTQQRPDLFALHIRKPLPLHEAVVEVDERIATDGSVLQPFAAAPELQQAAEQLLAQGVTVAAIALVNSYRNAAHEHRLAEQLRALGYSHVRCSTELSPLINFHQRAETALVDAYLTPIVEAFFQRIATARRDRRSAAPLVMTSAGGLVRAERFHAKDGLLSGPAAGVVGAATVGRACGYDRIITFDMGGTSTDVARFDRQLDYRFVQQVGDARLATTALAIESVAAGGGSICRCAHGRLRVGPDSAGASPGPACYGAGGPLTLTDVNLLLGRLDSRRFGIPVYPKAAQSALDAVRRTLHEQSGQHAEPDALLEGFLEIANERMADTIRQVSLRRGYEPAEHALVAFGGAGPQHACGVARCMGIDTILVPADAGLLSALGLGHARIERIVERQLLVPLSDVSPKLEALFAEMGRDACNQVIADGAATTATRVRRRIANLRYVGQDTALSIEYGEGDALGQAFEQRYAELYGHRPDGRTIEVESLRTVAGSDPPVSARGQAEITDDPPAPPAVPNATRARFGGRWVEAPCYERERLSAGTTLPAPSIVTDRYSTTVIEPGWQARVHESGTLLLQRRRQQHQGTPAALQRQSQPEAVRLELFAHRLATIAEEMGELMRRTALSTNIKERLDFSCAVLDRDGQLVVNAPHIPVHLGSLGLCVRRVRAALSMGPDDVVVTNHPAHGGSHLPDVTVIAPVYHDGDLLGYVANRAHHAEIGGTRPGSMPPHSTCLAEEGVVIAPRYLVREGDAQWHELRELLAGGPWPSRNVADNIADLRAAVASVHHGAVALRRFAAQSGTDVVRRSMRQLEQLAAQQLRRALAQLAAGRYHCQTTLDDGSRLAVVATVADDGVLFDFSGSAAVHPGNLNATEAIVRSAVLYVLRLLIDRPLPLNEGLMAHVKLNLPAGLLNPPFSGDPSRDPAVVGGNVETSQRLVDCLVEALGLAANSQGTMNNVLFGNERFGYYETVGGGSGAGPSFDGASAVHCHMTNTRITDAEVLEHRYPVRVDRFAIRRGSGGSGLHRGGDGVIRELTFLQPLELSMLTQRRTSGPSGLAGGQAGQPGLQHVLRASGQRLVLGSIDGCQVQAGDRLVLETPGGGGYGKPG